MASESTQVLVLRDGDGYLYLLDRNTIEANRVPDERRAEVQQLLQEDVGGYFFDTALLNNVTNVGQSNNANANNVMVGVFAAGPQTILQLQGNTANVGTAQSANP
jgi:hypothetical protein